MNRLYARTPSRAVVALLFAFGSICLLSSCALLIPNRHHSGTGTLNDQRMTLTSSDRPGPLVFDLYPGVHNPGMRSSSGPFGSYTDLKATSQDPPAKVNGFYERQLAAKQPKTRMMGNKTQYTWREQQAALTLTVMPAASGTGTDMQLHIRGY